jgi:gas vesicle protein
MSIFRFFAGLLSGTALGLLFAKQEGKSLRKKMKGKDSKAIAEMIGTQMIAAGKDAKESLTDLVESEDVKKLVKKGKDEIKTVAKKAKDEINKKTPVIKKAIKKATPQAKKILKDTQKTIKKASKKASDSTKKALKRK